MLFCCKILTDFVFSLWWYLQNDTIDILPIRTFQRSLAVARIIGYIRREMEAAKMSAKVVSEVKVTFDKIIKLKVTRPREVKEKPLVND